MIQLPRPGWNAMLSGMLYAGEPATSSCTCGVAAFVAALAAGRSVTQMVSP
jgi:hypothetical protein